MPTPSLLIVPARFKTGKMYSQIPTSGDGDFTVTRNTAARRFNSAGLLESVASGIPRLDYYTSGGVTGCPALLVEPAGTNGILNSTDTTTNWLLGANLTSGAIDVIGVSGNNLTVSVSGSFGSNNNNLRRTSNNVALASGSTYTISFLMKKTGANTLGGYYAVITGGAAGDLGAGFDVSGSFSSGSFFTSTSTINRIRRVEQWGTDVYRCSETFTMSASGTLTNFAFGVLESLASPTNTVVGSSMGFAAPQIELGSVPTSFIPTAAASGSRSADVISVTGAVSGSIGQTEGTMYVEVDVTNRLNGTAALTLAKDANVSGRVIIYTNTSNRWRANYTDASGTIVDTSAANDTQVLGVNKLAFAYGAGGNATLHCNGSLIITLSGTSTFVQELRAIFLGSSNAGALFFNNRIRAAALYTTRLTDAELATLTTL